MRRVFQVEVDVVSNEQVEIAIAVVVGEGAARTVANAGDGKLSFFGDVLEGAVAAIAIERVVSLGSDQHVGMTIVVVIAGTDALAPTGLGEPGFSGDIGKVSVSVVVIELRQACFFR